MTKVLGISGFEVASQFAQSWVCPPYDVIKPGSALEHRLQSGTTMYDIILGSDPQGALKEATAKGVLVRQDEPAYYVTEQRWSQSGNTFLRRGVFVAMAVSAYGDGEVIRHEKTFDDKVRGRLARMRDLSLTLEPIFGLTRAPIAPLLSQALSATKPSSEAKMLFEICPSLEGSDLHLVTTKAVRVAADSPLGHELQNRLAQCPVYIADGHHRYHAALIGGLKVALAYLTDEAAIEPYNRVITGTVPFSVAKTSLPLRPASTWQRPSKHTFSILTKEGVYELDAPLEEKQGEVDPVRTLDVSRLEHTLYPALGLKREMVMDPKHFDYFPESQNESIQALVEAGRYEIGVALAPVDLPEFYQVADKGIADLAVVMPEKSTFFSPKILSGMWLLDHTRY